MDVELGPDGHLNGLDDNCPLMQIMYRDLTVTVQVKKKDGRKKVTEERQLLKGITGAIQPARLTAVMGASGAGKTTFLNVLAGIGIPNAQVSSDITVNGEKMAGDRMRRISGFVHQEDVILDTMTVREALVFAAFLRLPGTIPTAEKRQRALDVAELLNLTKSLDNVVGSALIKGISGGEKRRLSLGMQMITNPSILFLDEPTSGLDTYTAHKVVSILARVATVHGRTVMATIHQPSSDIFHMFHDLIVLADGRVLYHGAAKAMVPYFSALGYECPTYTNPADFLFMSILNTEPDNPLALLAPPSASANGDEDILVHAASKGKAATGVHATPNGVAAKGLPAAAAHGSRRRREEDERRVGQLLDAWEGSQQKRELLEAMDSKATTGGITRAAINARAPWLLQGALLAQRAGRNMWRNKLIFKGKLAQTLFLSLVVGLIYLNVNDDLRGVQDRQGCIFFVVVQTVFGSIFGTLTVFGAERGVFQREFSSRMYGLPVYFLSRWAVELPNHIVMPIISSVIIYFMVGLRSGFVHFLWWAVVLVLLDNCGASVGVLAGCIFNNIEVAVAVMPMVVLPLMVFSGFFVNTKNIPPYFRWISYISPMRYGFIASSKNEFEGLAIYCKPEQKCAAGYNGDDVIRIMGVADQGTVAENAAILLGLTCGFLAVAYVALWLNVRKLNN